MLNIAAFITINNVIAVSAKQFVISGPAANSVIACAGMDYINADIPLDDIMAAAEKHLRGGIGRTLTQADIVTGHIYLVIATPPHEY